MFNFIEKSFMKLLQFHIYINIFYFSHVDFSFSSMWHVRSIAHAPAQKEEGRKIFRNF